MRIVSAFFIVVAMSGCYDKLSFDCRGDDSKCGTGGICVDSACAFAAADCPSGLRFDKSAGTRGGQCVDQGNDMGVDNQGDDLSVDMPDLATTPDLTITCGTPGLPCCNLTCNPGVTCTGSQCQAASFWVGGSNSGLPYSAHWDGNAWSAVTVTGPSPAIIESIWGTSGTNMWAAGFSGNSPSTTAQIWHYDGAGWSVCATGNTCTSAGTTSAQLDAVFGLSTTDIWAVGVGEAVHWNGASWTSKNTGIPVSTAAHGVWCAATGDCWIVSPSNMYHWNGSDWNTSYAVGSAYAGSVFGFATDDVWAGTGPGFSGAGVLIHWNGSAWSAAATIQGTNNAGVIRGIWGIGPSDVWAVGDNGFIAHWDGTQWSRITSNTTDGLSSVWGVASKDVWAAGSATIVHWNGTQWSASQPLGTSESFAAVWGPMP